MSQSGSILPEIFKRVLFSRFMVGVWAEFAALGVGYGLFERLMFVIGIEERFCGLALGTNEVSS